jgi:hypothetical protein
MKAKTKEREEVTITANEIITELWKLLNTSPSKTGGLTGSQRAALKLLLEIRGGEEFMTSRRQGKIEGLLHCVWESAHKNVAKARANLKAQAWATAISMLILRGQAFAGKTNEERLFYWRQGCWPI